MVEHGPQQAAGCMQSTGIAEITVTDGEKLHALCWALGATLEELSFLTARGWKQIVNFRPDVDASVLPAPRAARSVPRAAVLEEGPADDVAPAKASLVRDDVQSSWTVTSEDMVLLRDARGVILAPEAND